MALLPQPRRKRWIEASALILASACIHWAGFLAVSVSAGSAPRDPTLVRGDDGDNGEARATVLSEFSVQSPPPPPPPPQNNTPTQSSEPSVVGSNEGPASLPATVTSPRVTPPRATAQPPSIAHSAAPVHRTGSIGEQRGMLPRAARCRDPVAGTWRAHKYDPSRRDWVIFTLRIQRHPDNRLQGAITARTWAVGPEHSSPPGRCLEDPASLDYLVTMDGNGMLTDGNRVRFSAIEARVARAYCRNAMFRYAPDAFSGVIDAERQEFNSVNNDGDTDVNAPYVFRRIGCLPGDAATNTSASGATVTP